MTATPAFWAAKGPEKRHARYFISSDTASVAVP